MLKPFPIRFLYTIILFVLLAAATSCNRKKSLFQSLSSSQTGIYFINKVEENDTYNVLNYMNIYTGAGVAAGDVNNDGLTDLFFSGNGTSCRLYINKGNMQFEDITEKAGLTTTRWCTGVSMVDINQDGFLDIYINVSGSAKFGNTANLLYINNGLHSRSSAERQGEVGGEVIFTEEAEKYGIAETRLTMNASFFDYDRDGDLDLFLITNPADERVDDLNSITESVGTTAPVGADILYRNNGNKTFTDVSKEAGITKGGFSLGAAISDVNGDDWPDIYVSNDFLNSDILYINNRNGTFTDKIHACLKHTSFSSMGNDVADFNNDGLPDIFTLDMLPEDNYRKKMIIPSANYDMFRQLLDKGYEPQYTRNALQLNNGFSFGENRSEVTFSDIAFLSGVSSTDWSWAPLFADFDNDGDKDLMITNGFYRDFGDQDFIHYQAGLNNSMGSDDAKRAQKLKAIKALANIPLEAYLFENNGDLTFTKRSAEWGFTKPGFSNGACYTDLDNDGDLELVINEFNSTAKIFKNNGRELSKNNYLNIHLTGNAPNRQAIGSKVYIYTKGNMQMEELNPYRGYESTMELQLHFGLGKNTAADSVAIVWPGGIRQMKYNVAANETINIQLSIVGDSSTSAYAGAGSPVNGSASEMIFKQITGEKGLIYSHKENYFVDFKFQPLLPHMHSRCGPGIAVGDINNDGKEDFYIGGASACDGSFFIQNSAGGFTERKLKKDTLYEDMGVLLFDADSDGDLDLFAVSGSSEKEEGSDMQQDRLYINNGRGNFILEKKAVPDTRASGSCVVACDYDKDGDLDLFVGGRVVPGNYPLTPRSYLLKNNCGKFFDVSDAELPSQGKIGMVTSALWTDYDNDGWTDLMLAGEFMPLTFIKNKNGKLLNNLPLSIEHSRGWWNSLTAGDFDGDGDVDYVAGNLGVNTRFKASAAEPLCIYAKDFNKDGRIDPVMCYYIGGKNYTYPSRDELIRQIPAMRTRFQSYKEYASATFEQTFTKEELSDAFLVKSECFETSYFENKGSGKFERKTMPLQCQFAPVFGMLSGDYNNDGHLDILVTGNSYSTEVSTGNYDAMPGLLLLGDGKGNFKPENSAFTGFNPNNDSKGIARVDLANNTSVILVANNNDQLQAYEFKKKNTVVPVNQNDAYAIIHSKDRTSFKQELYHGNSYLSGSAEKLYCGDVVSSVTLVDNKGVKREIRINSK